MDVAVVGPAIREAMDQPGVAVVSEDHQLVRREEGIGRPVASSGSQEWCLILRHMKGSRSIDLREQAPAAFARGMKRSQVCDVFGMHRTTLRRWEKRVDMGQLENRPRCGGRRQIKAD